MNTDEKLSVILKKGGQRDLAESIAKKVGASVLDAEADGINIIVDGFGVSLSGYGLTYYGDFTRSLTRITEGRLLHEMLYRVSKTKDENPTAIDATAGMGEDSIILAAAGYNVTMFEKDPVVAALLKDALRRAKKHPVLGEIVARMTLIDGDSAELMPKRNPVDIIYLDPMFPERKKSGLINKKLQLIQHLERPCTDEKELLSAAIAAHPKKIVIKRPQKGENLAGVKPDYSIMGKAIRYDVIQPTT